MKTKGNMNNTNKKSKWSRFWFDEDYYDNYYTGYNTPKTIKRIDDQGLEIVDVNDYIKQEAASRERLISMVKLGAFKRSASNFVRILTGQDIPVKFNNGDASYTDGKSVVLSGNIENNFDSSIGLALHEASHIVKTDFGLLLDMLFRQDDRSKYITHDMVNKIVKLSPKIEKWDWRSAMGIDKDRAWGEIYDKYPKKQFFNEKEKDNNLKTRAAEMFLFLQLKDIINWIEDRRIDDYVYSTSPGYRGYYEALYDRYFYSKDVDAMLKNDTLNNTETLESYMFRLINLLNKNNDLSALKGLSKIKNLIDVSNIRRFKNTTQVAEVASEVLSIIVNNITAMSDIEEILKKYKKQDAMFDVGENDNNSIVEIDLDQLSDDECKKMFGVSKSKLKQMLKKAKAQSIFVRGETKKTRITKQEKTLLDSMTDNGMSIELAGGEEFNGQRIQTIFIKRITDSMISLVGETQLVHSENVLSAILQSKEMLEYRKSQTNSETAVLAGLRLGKVLAKKLQIRNEVKTLKHSRLDAGKIDRRLVSSLGYDVSNVFHKLETNKYKNVHLHLSIDASGSMSGMRFYKSIKTATAIAEASKSLSNVECVISFRSSYGMLPLVLVAYDSRVNGISHIRKYFKHLIPGGGTPESLCFESLIQNSIPKVSKDTDLYFVNFSDGEPYFTASIGQSALNYSGDAAIRHCRRMIKKLENEHGAKIISYFINDYEMIATLTTFKSMYGAKNAFNIRTDNIDSVARTLNSKFLDSNSTITEIS